MRLYKTTTTVLLCFVAQQAAGFTATNRSRRRTLLSRPLSSSISPDSFDSLSESSPLPFIRDSSSSVYMEQGAVLSSDRPTVNSDETSSFSLPAVGAALLFLRVGILALAVATASSTTHHHGGVPPELLHLNHVMHTVPSTLAHLPSLAWDSYQSVLARHPIATKAGTSAFVYALGDILAQTSAAGKDSSEQKLDVSRVLKSLVAGGVGHGPLSHVWYNVSEEFFHNIVHWTAWWSFMPKIVVDQFVWGPIWTTIYLGMIGMMNRDSSKDIQQSVQTNLWPLIVDGLKLWPLAHCVTYGLIPVENRLLWVDLVEIVWVSILANAASSGTSQTSHHVQAPPPADDDEPPSLLVAPTMTASR